MSRGLLAVAEMLGMIGASAKLAAADIRETVEAKREAEQATATTSSMSRAAGGGTSTMGSSASKGVTTNGLAAALQITRGRSL